MWHRNQRTGTEDGAAVVPLRRRGDERLGPVSRDVPSAELNHAFASLRQDQVPTPSDIVDDVLAYVFSSAESGLRERRTAWKVFALAGIAAAIVGVAVAATVVAWRSPRVRRHIAATAARVAERAGRGA